MDRNIFKAELIRKGLKQKDVADALGISVSTFNRKVFDDSFTVKELRTLSSLIGADMVQSIFFNETI